MRLKFKWFNRSMSVQDSHFVYYQQSGRQDFVLTVRKYFEKDKEVCHTRSWTYWQEYCYDLLWLIQQNNRKKYLFEK
jgi:hypothetical protein